MFGKNSFVTSLETRKRLLVAASQINRELLAVECETMATEAHGITQRVREFGIFSFTLASLAGGFSVFRKLTAKPVKTKPSWLSLAFNGIRFGLSLWAGGVGRRGLSRS